MSLRRTLSIGTQTLLALLATTSLSQAQLLVYEGFDYTDGQTIDNLDGGFGFNIPWTDEPGQLTVPLNAAVTSGSLQDPNGLVQTSGNALSVQGQGGSTRVFRTLDTTGALAPFVDGGEIGADGTTLYFGVVLQHGGFGPFEDEPAPVNQTNFLEVGTGSLNSAANAAFTVGIDTLSDPDQRAVTNKTPTGTVNIGDTSITPDLVVLKIEFGAGNSDTMSVFLNPTDAVTEPAATGTLNGDFSFNRIGFGGFQGSMRGLYDELRIAGSYADIFTLPPIETVDGDADNDGDVDLNDYEDIRDNFFSQIPIGGVGDVSGGGFNGVVDLQDYVIWKREFELIAGAGSAPPLFGVPEPSAVLSIAIAMTLGCIGRRGRSAC